MRRIRRETLVRVGIATAILVVLGVVYQHQRHQQQTPDAQAIATVKSELARRGVAVDRVSCETNHLDPAKLPAVVQVAGLHQDETPLLYDCTADLHGTPPSGEPGSDQSWCVLGFSGSAPWIAYATQHNCASMARTT
jgi:hypothetical protein